MAAASCYRVEQSDAREGHTGSSRRPEPRGGGVPNQLYQNQGKDRPSHAGQMPSEAKNYAGKVAGQNTFATRQQRTEQSPLNTECAKAVITSKTAAVRNRPSDMVKAEPPC
jgi:hypothetical protein